MNQSDDFVNDRKKKLLASLSQPLDQSMTPTQRSMGSPEDQQGLMFGMAGAPGGIGGAAGVIKNGNVLNAMEEFLARKKAPSANMAGEEGQLLNGKAQFVQKAFDARDAADLAARNGPTDPIEGFKNRFGDNMPKHIEQNAGQPHDEPYSHGDAHNIIWRSGNRDNPSVGPKNTSWENRGGDKMWNRPTPVPRKFDPEQAGGVLGKGVPDASGPDPFMWMDSRYGSGKQALIDSKGQPLDIHTRSDLIGRDDYLQHIDPQNHTVFMHIPGTSSQISRVLEPGAPSMLRRLDAAEKLRDAGIDVRLVRDQLVPPKMDKSQAQAFKEMLGDSMQDREVWSRLNQGALEPPNEIQLGPQQMQNINKALGTDFRPLVKKKK